MAEQNVRIGVIVGTTRPNRFSELPAAWITQLMKKRDGVETEMLDLRDYPMPFYNEPSSPSAITPEDLETLTEQSKSAAAEGAVKMTVYQAEEASEEPAAPKVREAKKPAPAAAPAEVADVIKEWTKK